MQISRRGNAPILIVVKISAGDNLFLDSHRVDTKSAIAAKCFASRENWREWFEPMPRDKERSRGHFQ